MLREAHAGIFRVAMAWVGAPPFPAIGQVLVILCPELARHVERMAVFETLLRRHTWFTEGSTKAAFRNSGTLGEGRLERYDIDAVVHEFNANWIAGLEDYPTGGHWE